MTEYFVNEYKKQRGKHVRIAAVIVTYNRKNLLKACVEHVIAQQGACCDVLVIDNHSTDGTKAALQPFIDAHARAGCACRPFARRQGSEW